MPIYEYRCQSCGHELEKLQKMSDQPLVDCPECNQPALTKLISAAAFRLKGSGWYETDFKTDNRRNLAGDEKSNKASDQKAGSKPASGSERKSGAGPTGSGSDKGAGKAPAGQVV